MNIVFDLFPARVLVIPEQDSNATLSQEDLGYTTPVPNSRKVEAVRLILTEHTIMMAGDSSNGPVLIFQEKYDASTLVLNKNRSKPGRLTTVNGKIIVFQKDENCGCGSKLRSWNPYRTVYSTKDPIE
jgi:hypothetical protein